MFKQLYQDIKKPLKATPQCWFLKDVWFLLMTLDEGHDNKGTKKGADSKRKHSSDLVSQFSYLGKKLFTASCGHDSKTNYLKKLIRIKLVLKQ